MSSVNLCRHFFFIQENNCSTNAAGYKPAAIPNWSCGGESVSSQQSVKRNRSAWKTGSFQGVPKNWLSIYQLVKSLQLVERQCPSQRVSSFTDEINELARSRRGSRQATSPPLHLYNIENDFNKKSGVKPNWRGGGENVSSHQLTARSQHAWKTCSYQEVPKNWLSICQLEKLLLTTRTQTSQRVSVNTDEINELARSRRGSRQATSPPLHLYSTKDHFNKNSNKRINRSAFSVIWLTHVSLEDTQSKTITTDICLSQRLKPSNNTLLLWQANRLFAEKADLFIFKYCMKVKPNWSCGGESVSSQSAVRSRYAWMFEHYQVSTVLLEITVNQRDKGIYEMKTALSKGPLLILKRLMNLLRVAMFKTCAITTTPSLYHNAGWLFT